MRVAFVFQSFENLGVEALSAALKRAGHETALFFDPKLFDDTFYHNGFLSNLFDMRTKVIRDLVGWEPDVVAFSVLSDLYPWATNMARSIKEVYKAPIIFGGIHPTSVPDIVIQDSNVDYVVQGEGDETIVELVDYIADGASPADLPNVWSKVNGEIKGNPPRPLIRDLDSLPFPDKALYDHTFVKGTRIYTIMASRGCPHKCTYCNAALLKELYCEEKGSHWRARSVDNVIEELEWAQSENRVGIINFYDEIFGANIKWMREFAPRYRREIGKPFISCAHPAHCTEEYVELLKEAGCIKVDLGVQSTDPTIRKEVLRRNETNEQIGNAIDRLMKVGIFLHVENIFNLPGQDEEITSDMARFYNRHRPNCIKIFGLRVYPRTPMEQILVERGLLTKEQAHQNACGPSSTASSFYMGGSLPDRSLFSFQSLFAIMLFLPPKWVDYIVEKRLYRYLPKRPHYMTMAARMINTQSWEEDVHKRSYSSKYIFYVLKHLKSIFLGSAK